MKFEDAEKEHDKGKDVYLKYDPDWFWLGSDVFMCLTNKSRNRTKCITDSDRRSTDWAVVEEKKVFNLSDTVKDMKGLEAYYEYDIQQFITEIKKIVADRHCKDKIISETLNKIDECAGERFK
ncbi:MAG: hypothetical protein KAK00_00310 [Nanoarchaeota archaeon]|nr:hypothetical protein [Nanoarchaeota archaeon]